MASSTQVMAKIWNAQGLVNIGRGTPCMPFSPPVTSVQRNAISQAICEKASVSSEKYRPLRRRMIRPITRASTPANNIEAISAKISLPTAFSMKKAAK